jgi:hypothetical protein
MATALLSPSPTVRTRRRYKPQQFDFPPEMLAALRQAEIDEAAASERNWGDPMKESDGTTATPTGRREKHRQMAFLLPALQDLEDSLAAVLRTKKDDDSRTMFFDDVAGLHHFAGLLSHLVENETPWRLSVYLKAAREQRGAALARGEFCHGCSVLWATKAIAGAKKALEASLKWRGTEWARFIRQQARPLLWLLDVGGSLLDNGAGRRMNATARAEYLLA